MALSADLLRGYTDTILLCQLAGGDSYGYEINKRVAELSDGAFELKEATLYTAFRRMEGAGMIISYWGNEATGARRRYYAITPAGRNRMHEDLAAWEETRKTLNALLTPAKEPENTPEETEIPMVPPAAEAKEIPEIPEIQEIPTMAEAKETPAAEAKETPAAAATEIPVIPRTAEKKEKPGISVTSIPDGWIGGTRRPGDPDKAGKTEIPVIRIEEEGTEA